VGRVVVKAASSAARSGVSKTAFDSIQRNGVRVAKEAVGRSVTRHSCGCGAAGSGACAPYHRWHRRARARGAGGWQRAFMSREALARRRAAEEEVEAKCVFS